MLDRRAPGCSPPSLDETWLPDESHGSTGLDCEDLSTPEVLAVSLARGLRT